jgi:succinate-semialdehyde dehydrogenase / glutarate-semialdehyde dehydrogenase
MVWVDPLVNVGTVAFLLLTRRSTAPPASEGRRMSHATDELHPAAGTDPGVGVTAAAPQLPADLLARLRRHVVVTGARDELPVVSPLSERELGRVPVCTAEDVAEAVRRARVAQRRWAQRPVRERVVVLRRLARLVLEQQDEVLDLIQLESGKARAHAFEEVGDVSVVASYYARTAATHLRDRRREGAFPLLTTTSEVRHPKGVVGVIAPWNYPLSMAITDAIPALAAGNACVLKPAQQTPFTALWAVDLAREAGLPEDLLTVVTGRGSVLGEPLIDAVDFVTLTGSTDTGRQVARRAVERLVGVSLELGGKNAMLVLEDADLDAAVEGAIRGCFASAGQLCISIERLLVHAAIAEEFTTRFVERAQRLRLSVDLAWGGQMGSLASRDQLETVTRHVEGAVAQGARVLAGGQPRPDVGPLVYAPTVLTDVTESMEVHGCETFGPVVTLSTFEDEDDAITRANATPYGLNASVWSGDRRHAAAVARRLHAGTVNVNEAYAAAWASVDAPMGGVGDSGLGRRHGREGIWKYTEEQTIAIQRLLPVGTLPGLSDERTAQVLTFALRVLGRLPRPRLPRR